MAITIYTADNKRQYFKGKKKSDAPNTCSIRDGIYYGKDENGREREECYMVDRCGNIFYSETPGAPLRLASDTEFIEAEKHGFGSCSRNLTGHESRMMGDFLRDLQ